MRNSCHIVVMTMRTGFPAMLQFLSPGTSLGRRVHLLLSTLCGDTFVWRLWLALLRLSSATMADFDLSFAGSYIKFAR